MKAKHLDDALERALVSDMPFGTKYTKAVVRMTDVSQKETRIFLAGVLRPLEDIPPVRRVKNCA